MNNFKTVSDFLLSNSGKIAIIAKVNEEVTLFYKLLFQKICEKEKFRLIYVGIKDSLEELGGIDLFGEKKAYVIDRAILKNTFNDINETLSSDTKVFSFISYQNYKKYSKTLVGLNAYDYKKDMVLYLKNYIDDSLLNNHDLSSLLNRMASTPHMFFSELDKFLLNSEDENNYQYNEEETIASIRKSVFSIKNDFSLKMNSKLYGFLKKETQLKKFNF